MCVFLRLLALSVAAGFVVAAVTGFKELKEAEDLAEYMERDRVFMEFEKNACEFERGPSWKRY